MIIVGCDFHPGWQQVAVFDSATGEIQEQKLENGNGQAERFYRRLRSPARVGFEACGNTQWFEDLLDSLGHEVWIGDAAEIRASYVRKQKTDRRDAAHILKLLIEDRFPRLWRPSQAERNLRQFADSSPSSGWDSYASEERVAASDAEPGCATQAEVVERSRAEGITRVATGGLGGTAATGFTAAAQRAEPTDRQVGSGGRACGAATPASVSADDATRGRADHSFGLRHHDGRGDPLPARQASSQLSGSDPQRA
jgi:hypothetical protein